MLKFVVLPDEDIIYSENSDVTVYIGAVKDEGRIRIVGVTAYHPDQTEIIMNRFGELMTFSPLIAILAAFVDQPASHRNRERTIH